MGIDAATAKLIDSWAAEPESLSIREIVAQLEEKAGVKVSRGTVHRYLKGNLKVGGRPPKSALNQKAALSVPLSAESPEVMAPERVLEKVTERVELLTSTRVSDDPESLEAALADVALVIQQGMALYMDPSNGDNLRAKAFEVTAELAEVRVDLVSQTAIVRKVQEKKG